MAHCSVSCEWLHGDGLQELKRALLSGIGDGGHLEGQGRGCTGGRLAGIAHDGGELFEQRAEAVGWGAIVQRVGRNLLQSPLGALRRGDGIATARTWRPSDVDRPMRCGAYLPGPDDLDRRSGRERWPFLFGANPASKGRLSAT